MARIPRPGAPSANPSRPHYQHRISPADGYHRAYYAAFGHPRSEGFLGLESAEDHVRLRDHFGRTGRQDLARVLNKLRQWRNHADYQTEPGNLPMMLKESLAEAQRIINRLG